MKKKLISVLVKSVLFFSVSMYSQSIENKEVLSPFIHQINNEKVTQILFLGDSHIQADWLTGFLRKKFQEEFGNAGRGLVFPFSVANTNGPEDYTSSTNKTWENFRLVHNQKIFPAIGISGFVIGNHEDSFLEIQFKNSEDSYDKVLIFNDEKMVGENFQLFHQQADLKDFVIKSSENVPYNFSEGETFHEVASKFYTTTTKLIALNGAEIRNPKIGKNYIVERNTVQYLNDFEKFIQKINDYPFTNAPTIVNLPELHQKFLMKTNAIGGNVFYGFQFLKNVKSGVVFNTVGVNGATYADFIKYPMQISQLKQLPTDLLIIALGTNESLSTITKEEFKNNAKQLITFFRSSNKNLPILLITPTDNALKPNKIKEIVLWIREVAKENNTAFFSLYEATGGEGYFKQSLNTKEANADGVHFLKKGYQSQAEKIWKAFTEILK